MATLLIVSSEGRTRELLVQISQAAGHRVHQLPGIESLSSTVAKVHPHVVVIDMVHMDQQKTPLLRGLLADSVMDACTVVGILSQPTRRSVIDLAQLGFNGLLVQGPMLAEAFKTRLPHWTGPLTEEKAGTPATPSAAGSLAAAAGSSASAGSIVPEPPPGVRALQSLDFMPMMEAVQELKKIKPLIGRTDLIKLVDEGADLRAMRPVVQRVLSAMASPSCSVEDVARAVKQDHALSLKVMRLANSALFSRGDKVETIGDAVKRIGLAQLRESIMSMSVVEQFNRSYLDGRIDAGTCWEHSIGVGLIASRIGKARGLEADAMDQLFTAGLLHDVGKMILFEQAPELMKQVVETADQLSLPWEIVESRLLLLNHAEVTDRVLRSWKFPPHLTNLIANHHLEPKDIKERCPNEADDAITLALADRLAHAARIGSSGNDVLYPIEDFCAALRLGEAAIQQILEGLHEQTQELKLCMLASSSDSSEVEPDGPPLDAMGPRALLIEDPGEVSWLPVAWKSLGGLQAEGSDEIHVVVARLTKRFGVAEVAARLEEMRGKRGESRPPVILLAPSGLKVEAERLENTATVALEEPTPVADLVRAVTAIMTATTPEKSVAAAA